jgi:hypothetical protein
VNFLTQWDIADRHTPVNIMVQSFTPYLIIILTACSSYVSQTSIMQQQQQLAGCNPANGIRPDEARPPFSRFARLAAGSTGFKLLTCRITGAANRIFTGGGKKRCLGFYGEVSPAWDNTVSMYRSSWGILPKSPVFSLRSARCHRYSSITALFVGLDGFERKQESKRF